MTLPSSESPLARRSALFRAVAVDYDGTLAHGSHPSGDVLEAIQAIRAQGIRVLLVTGRILRELRRDFPDVDRHFDAIVAEDGAVLALPGAHVRTLAHPVPPELAEALERRGVPIVRGQVLLATDAVHDGTVLQELTTLGLDCKLLRNRGALMVLPASVSKGAGTYEALAELGISHHSAIGIGDAENDHSLLDSCEVGVAVADAIESLKAHADVILSQPDGAGVAAFLRGPLVSGDLRVQPRRWRAELGRYADDSTAAIPASQVNVLISGESNSGKSYLAGLFAEKLIAMGYCLCVLDPEGDHLALGGLRGVMTLGGEEPLPPPAQLGRLIRHRFGSVVADLSLLAPEEKEAYLKAALAELTRQRLATGLPHWIFIDEAHLPLGVDPADAPVCEPAQKGLCFVTYRPDDLPSEVIRELDLTLTLVGGPESRDQAVLDDGGTARRFTVGQRASTHVRHWHKYTRAHLPPHLRFLFRDEGRPTGAQASNIEEFHRHLSHARLGVFRHHAGRGDFSRWIEQALQDPTLATSVRGAEGVVAGSPIADDLHLAQRAILDAISDRYFT